MSRKTIFDAVRAAGGKFASQADVDEMDAVLDRRGVPRDQSPSLGSLVPSLAAVELIKQFETCELKAYPDPGSADGNPWTIGWGATGPGISKGVAWTQQQADQRLKDDLARFSGKVAELVSGSATSQQEFDALVSFAYNVGTGALAGSTLLKKHRAGDKVGAANEFARWNKNDGSVMRGLTRRRASEAALYRGGA